MEGMICECQRCFIGPLKLHQNDNCYLKDFSIFLSLNLAMPYTMAPLCSGYDYCTTSFNQVWELKFCGGLNPASSVLEICDVKERWQWSTLETRCKRLSSVNHSAKTIHQFMISVETCRMTKEILCDNSFDERVLLSTIFKTITLFGDSFVYQGCTFLL